MSGSRAGALDPQALERADTQNHVAFVEVAHRVPPRLDGGIQVRGLLPVERAVEHRARHRRLDVQEVSRDGAHLVELGVEESLLGRGRPQPGHATAGGPHPRRLGAEGEVAGVGVFLREQDALPDETRLLEGGADHHAAAVQQ